MIILAFQVSLVVTDSYVWCSNGLILRDLQASKLVRKSHLLLTLPSHQKYQCWNVARQKYKVQTILIRTNQVSRHSQKVIGCGHPTQGTVSTVQAYRHKVLVQQDWIPTTLHCFSGRRTWNFEEQSFYLSILFLRLKGLLLHISRVNILYVHQQETVRFWNTHVHTI